MGLSFAMSLLCLWFSKGIFLRLDWRFCGPFFMNRVCSEHIEIWKNTRDPPTDQPTDRSSEWMHAETHKLILQQATSVFTDARVADNENLCWFWEIPLCGPTRARSLVRRLNAGSRINLHFTIAWLRSRCCCPSSSNWRTCCLCVYPSVCVRDCMYLCSSHSLSLSLTKLLIIFVYDVRFLLHIIIINIIVSSSSSSSMISSLLSTATEADAATLREWNEVRKKPDKENPKKSFFFGQPIQMECFAWCMQFQMHLNRMAAGHREPKR